MRWGLGKQVIEDLCGEDGLAFELGLEIEASDEAASALLTRAVEGDLRGVPLQEAAHPASDLVLGADTPAFGDEGKGSEVDEVLDGADLGETTLYLQEITEQGGVLCEGIQELRSVSLSLCRETNLVG